MIDSPALAQAIENAVDRRISAGAYEVRLSDDGKLYWIERRQGASWRYDLSLAPTFGTVSAVRVGVTDRVAVVTCRRVELVIFIMRALNCSAVRRRQPSTW